MINESSHGLVITVKIACRFDDRSGWLVVLCG